MWRADRARAARLLAALAVAGAVGCTTVVVYGEQLRGSHDGVLRVAEEFGIRETGSTRLVGPGRMKPRRVPLPVRIEIPLEVRAGADSVRLAAPDSVAVSGCAVQKFRFALRAGVLLTAPAIQPDPDLRLVLADSADRVVRPGERRLVRLVLTKPSSDPAAESFVIRLDQRRSMLDSIGTCPDQSLVGDSILHYNLRRVEVEPLGPGLAAGVILVLAVVRLGR